MATSRLEAALAAIQDEFQQITTANGYINDLDNTQVILTIRHPGVIKTHPEIGIQCVNDVTMPLNDNWSLYTSLCDIRVCGRVKPYKDMTLEATKMNEAIENLAHDMKTVMAGLLKKYVVNATAPWVVADEGRFRMQRNQVITPQLGWGEAVLTFQILLRNQTSAFT